jgi:hypothetical protein
MRDARIWIAMFSVLLSVGACSDSPTAPMASAPDAAYDYMEVQGCVSGGICGLPEYTTPGEPDEPPDCEMWWKPDCGACATGAIGSPEDMQGTYGCAGDGGDPYTPPPGGGSAGTGTTPPPSSTAYEEGPLTWGVCVLAVLGSVYSIDQVADAFLAWWNAQKEFESAKRMYDAVVTNPELVSPETIQLWEFQVQYYKDRRDAAISAVSEKTGASYWALGAAGLSCGAALFLPTP